jgi:hypothetical protein
LVIGLADSQQKCWCGFAPELRAAKLLLKQIAARLQPPPQSRRNSARTEPVLFGGALMIRFALAAAAFVSCAAPALADAPRFQLQQVDGGVVRLDTVTGAMDFCRTTGAGLQCEAALGGAPRATSTAADLTQLDPKQVEQQMDQASKAMSLMLPAMMKAMGQMRTTMEREMDKPQNR